MISSDLPEISALTHRLLVLHGGSLAATLLTGETTQETSLAYVAGVATSNKGDTRMSGQEPTQIRRQP